MDKEEQGLIGQRSEHSDFTELSPQDILAAARIALMDPEYGRLIEELRFRANQKATEQTPAERGDSDIQ